VNVVHIGESGGGGAAHAMSRLHEALQRIGIHSRLLLRNGADPANDVETIATRGDADELFPTVREAVIRQYVELNRTAISNTHFSLHIDGADVSRVPSVASSDIVHLHWTATFQTPADVRALLRTKAVVWTLHDLEPLTGGCHFPAGCDRYVSDCAGCPQLAHDPFRITEATLRDKTMLWAGGRPTFIAPSRYIAERARLSAVAQSAGASIVQIPHGIDLAAFRPRSKADARRALGVPADGTYILCGSNYNAEKRKGLGILDRLLATAKARSQRDASTLTLLTVGEPKLDLHDLGGTRIIQLGRVAAGVMPTVYAAADLFVHPAVEDNFPCMLLESLSCGTPAIAFDIGGVADIVRDELCGRLVAAGDELAMAAALSSLVGDREGLQRMAVGARAHVEEHFSADAIARKHAELYDHVLERRPASRAPAGSTQKTAIEEIFPRLSTACLIEELAFARERVGLLGEGSRANAARIAALEGETARLTLGLATERREVQEKEAERAAIQTVAEERKALAVKLHASAASIEAIAASLQREVRVRDDLLATLEVTIQEQRAEIELVHRAASERKALAKSLHESAASIEALAANLQREVRERDVVLAALERTIAEQRAEIELVHRVASDRLQLIEDLHQVAEERAAVIDQLSALFDARRNGSHAADMTHAVLIAETALWSTASMTSEALPPTGALPGGGRRRGE
jgi:glycosyltransferase involved in cell wall biosynthesis